jgi:2-iminobutanoate/2-iminopropanoate deaminase
MRAPFLPAFLPVLVLCAALACATPRDTRHVAAEGALGPYSGSVATGDLVFLSGKIGERGSGLAHEVETALDAVAAELARAGLGLGDVVQATLYLTDMGDYAAVNAVWSARLPPPYPARTCVAVAALPGGAAFEVAVVAVRR